MSVLEMAMKKMTELLTFPLSDSAREAFTDEELRAVIAACQAVMAMHTAFEKIIMIDTGEA